MRRLLLSFVLICLGIYSLAAADPKIESALRTFKAIGTDSGKLKTFCQMTKAMDDAGEKSTPEDDAKIDTLMKALGPDFQIAWDAVEGPDDKNPDVKLFYDGLDALVEKCPPPPNPK
jgi:hypothetical protein